MRSIVRWLPLFLLLAAAAVAEEPKVCDVSKDGLVIDGKVAKDDPPLVNAPIDDAKGAPHQLVRVKSRRGQSYVVYLLSDAYDAFLMLQDSSGKTLAFNDDIGGGKNSRIVHVAKADGEYRFTAPADRLQAQRRDRRANRSSNWRRRNCFGNGNQSC